MGHHLLFWGCILSCLSAKGLYGEIHSFDVTEGQTLQGNRVKIVCQLTGPFSAIYIYKTETKNVGDATYLATCGTLCFSSDEQVYNVTKTERAMTVTVMKLKRTDDQRWWTCRSIPNDEQQFQLKVYTEPKFLELSSVNCDLAYSKCTLSCKTSCMYPRPTFSWYYSDTASFNEYYDGDRRYEHGTSGCSEWEEQATEILTLSRYMTLPENKDKTAVFKCSLPYFLSEGVLESNVSSQIRYAVQVQQVTISNDEHPLPPNYKVEVTENIEASLRCIAEASRPSPTITLHIGKNHIVPVTGGTGTFIPRNSHHDVFAYCKAKNFIGTGTTAATSNNVKIYVKVPIKSVEIVLLTGVSLNVILDTTEPVTCETDGGRPESTITWFKYKNGEQHVLGQNINISLEEIPVTRLQKTKSTVNFIATLNDVGSELSCSAMNLVDMKAVYSKQNKTLNIMFPPTDMKIIYANRNVARTTINVIKGTSVHLLCSARSNPEVNLYSWNTISSRDGNMTITNIQESITANCTARNVMVTSSGNKKPGITMSDVNINVQYGATITGLEIVVNGEPMGMDIVIGNETDTISVNCSVDSNPASTIQVFQANRLLAMSQNEPQLVYDISSALCSNTGQFSCKAWNQIAGDVKETRQLNIRCSPRAADGSTSSSVSVQQNASAVLSVSILAYPIPTRYSWHKNVSNTWKQIDNSFDIHLTNESLQYNLTIAQVKKEHYGQYRLSMKNEIGDPLNYLFFLREGQPDDLNIGIPDDVATKTAGIIGGVVGLVVVCLVIVCVVCLVRRREKFEGIKTKLFGPRSSLSRDEIQPNEPGYSYAAVEKPVGGKSLNIIESVNSETRLSRENTPASGYLYSQVKKNGGDSPMTIVQEQNAPDSSCGKKKTKKTKAAPVTVNEGPCYENPVLSTESVAKAKPPKTKKPAKTEDRKQVQQNHDGLQYVELSFSGTKKKGKKTKPAQPKADERVVYDAVEFGVVGAAYTSNGEENSSKTDMR